ncbi:MAG: membrane protein insertion efficiency factor YidD [Bryobacterales bacterium]
MNLGRRIVVFFLLFYKSQISPFLPSACKYQPTCSMYAKDAVERFGVRKGLYLTVKRLLRCHPFAQGGFDPVPDA